MYFRRLFRYKIENKESKSRLRKVEYYVSFSLTLSPQNLRRS